MLRDKRNLGPGNAHVYTAQVEEAGRDKKVGFSVEETLVRHARFRPMESKRGPCGRVTELYGENGAEIPAIRSGLLVPEVLIAA